jgi:hypothetical protein
MDISFFKQFNPAQVSFTEHCLMRRTSIQEGSEDRSQTMN